MPARVCHTHQRLIAARQAQVRPRGPSVRCSRSDPLLCVPCSAQQCAVQLHPCGCNKLMNMVVCGWAVEHSCCLPVCLPACLPSCLPTGHHPLQCVCVCVPDLCPNLSANLDSSMHVCIYRSYSGHSYMPSACQDTPAPWCWQRHGKGSISCCFCWAPCCLRGTAGLQCIGTSDQHPSCNIPCLHLCCVRKQALIDKQGNIGTRRRLQSGQGA